MDPFPQLNLNNIVPDPELVNRIPHALALYYLALPLAREDGEVSVAMAYPENATALAILSRLLGAPIVPVRGAAEAIGRTLQTLGPSQAMPTAGILGWSDRAGWADAVAAWAQRLGRVLDAPVTLLASAQKPLDDCLGAGAGGRYRLSLLGLPDHACVDHVLRQATRPLFFVRGPELRPLRRILVVLRGFSSDRQVLDWAIALTQATPATLTLMPLSGKRSPIVQEVLGTNGSPRQPSESLPRRASLDDLRIYLKVRQGQPAAQIADEAEEGDHDLILISAEGDGAFVAQALAEVNRRDVHKGRPILILKPTL